MRRLILSTALLSALASPAQAEKTSKEWQALCQTDPLPCVGVIEGFLQGLEKALRRMDGYNRMLLMEHDEALLATWPKGGRAQVRHQLLSCPPEGITAEDLVPVWMAYLKRRAEEAGDPVGKTLPAAIRHRYICE
ncbi:hypothetical protein [Magnetospira sp. QH-2]|uniref:hypothetical protein n=1 Tax=Magnetospira sp. (strain QH-2) TaxID=1288970 RepID=UPI0003E81327|nr:hypothetical protein [Magnetospira sp. QH-2]CCQ72624.1 exported protein of unknown function [Magnetospira sp. QH-2]